MSLEDFQLLDIEPFDNSFIKRDSLKVYDQQGVHLNQDSQNIEIILGENNNYQQIGNDFLEFSIKVRENDTTNFHYDDPIRLLNNAFAFCFTEARLSTTIGSDIKRKKFGQVSKILKKISKKAGDSLSQFDKINEKKFQSLRDLLTYHPKIYSHLTIKC